MHGPVLARVSGRIALGGIPARCPVRGIKVHAGRRILKDEPRPPRFTR